MLEVVEVMSSEQICGIMTPDRYLPQKTENLGGALRTVGVWYIHLFQVRSMDTWTTVQI